MKISNLRLAIGAIVCLFTLCQCTATRTPKPKVGGTYLTAVPETKYRAGLKGMRIASVNGTQLGKRATAVPAGSVKAVISVKWPEVGKVDVPMTFRAREGHSYFVRYDVYPHVGKKYNGEGVMENIFSGGDPYAGLGAVLIAPVVVAAVLTKKAAGHSSHGKDRNKRHPRYMDLMVISRLSSEGVVSHVRVFPSGEVSKQ